MPLSRWSIRQRELGAITLILLAGFFLRTLKLSEVPSGMLWDEAASGLDLLPLFDGRFPVFFTEHSGHEAMFFYLAAASLKAFGWTAFASRLPMVVLNTLTIAVTYALIRGMFGVRGTLTGAL